MYVFGYCCCCWFFGAPANKIVNFKPFRCLDIVDIVVVIVCFCFWGEGARKIVNFKLFTCLGIVDNFL